MTDRQRKLLRLSLWLGGGYLFFRVGLKTVLPWFSPFLLTFGTAALMERFLSPLLQRFSVKRVFLSAVFTLLGTTLILGIAVLLLWEAWDRLVLLSRDLPELLARADAVLEQLTARMQSLLETAPPDVRAYLEESRAALTQRLGGIPVALGEALLRMAGEAAALLPRVLLSSVTYILATFFFSSTYPAVRGFLLRQPALSRLPEIGRGLRQALGKWLRTQAILAGITGGVVFLTCLLLRVHGALGVALFTGVIDALPVLGTGAVLLPWAGAEALGGNPVQGAFLLISYALCSALRSFLEPRLLGRRSGLHPAVTLCAGYVGLRALGIAGLILFPIALLVLQQLQEGGVVHLWK